MVGFRQGERLGFGRAGELWVKFGRRGGVEMAWFRVCVSGCKYEGRRSTIAVETCVKHVSDLVSNTEKVNHH